MSLRGRSTTAVLLGAALTCVALVLGLGRQVDLAALDRAQRLMPVHEESEVVLVHIDEASALAFGWPMDPALYAAAAKVLDDAGARSLGLDVVLSSHGVRFDPEGASTSTRPSDALLGEVARETPVVLAVQILRREVAARAGSLPATPEESLGACGSRPPAFVAPLRPGLERAPRGHVNVAPSVDGIHRALLPCLPVHDGCVRDLASVMTDQAAAPCDRVELVPFLRRFDEFPRLSFYDLVAWAEDEEGRARIEELVADRYVLIGASDPGIADVGATPASNQEPLFTVVANRIDALATGRSITTLPPSLPIAVGGLLALALAWLPLPARGWLAVTGGVLALTTLTSWTAFRLTSTWLPPSPLGLPLAVGALTAASHQGWRHLQFNQMLTRAFGRYVSPDVLDWLQATGGEALAPTAAERREVTVLFSDVVGYTGLSNRLPAERVMASLRLYLEAMIPIVQRHGGYLDKINGDGLMVIFGAPRPLEDAPGAAVQCARDMQIEVGRLQEDWRSLTDAELAIRLGLATGPAFVGNLGGEAHVEYTAIGPVVNLAARLEPQAPAGGMLIATATRDALGEPPAGEWVEVDLKGYDAQGPIRAWSVDPPS